MQTAAEILEAKGGEVISVAPQTTIYEALKIMNQSGIGAILVKDGQNIVGIWTERDLMSNIMEENFDPKTAKISDYMSKELKYSNHDDSAYRLQDKFLGMRLRHLLIQKDGNFIGLLSAGDVTKTLLNEKEIELKKLNAMVGWEYYENWRWRAKK